MSRLRVPARTPGTPVAPPALRSDLAEEQVDLGIDVVRDRVDVGQRLAIRVEPEEELVAVTVPVLSHHPTVEGSTTARANWNKPISRGSADGIPPVSNTRSFSPNWEICCRTFSP